LDQDINFADKCGFQKLLVLSGVTSKEILHDPKHTDNFLPDYYANSLADFIQFFSDHNNSKI
jgi:farnesyl diphosphate phosphatase